MARIKELLARITTLTAAELTELKNLILQELDGATPAGDTGTAPAASVDAIELSVLEELAEASTAVRDELARRENEKTKRAEMAGKLAAFREMQTDQTPPAADSTVVPESEDSTETATLNSDPVVVTPPADRTPRPASSSVSTTVTAGADLPGFAMGATLNSAVELAEAFTRRIESMRGIARGGDGDKIIVASAKLQGVPDALTLRNNDAEGNLAKVRAVTSPQAIVAAGGLGAAREVRYELFNLVGSADRPVKTSLPVFRTDRGGVRFVRSPSLNDLNPVVGVWTVQNDVDAATNTAIRKPSYRIAAGPEVVVDTQAITSILTVGNMMSRAYPELVARHNELALIAQARVAEQQLLTQIGALSTAVTGRAQTVGAVREFLLQVARSSAAYRNRHRMNVDQPMRAILPAWLLELLHADAMMGGDNLVESVAITDAQINAWLTARNLSVTWAMDGEAGQDYSSLTQAGAGAGGTVGFADFPATAIWYLFAEGTFSFMDGGTLDLGLVRDSTLNAANDYQMFVETFENVVRFGNDSYRVTSPLVVSGRSASDPQYVGAL